jgi:hypothetical protein
MENDLGRVVDALPGLICAALPDRQIDFLNQRRCEYTGLVVDEAYGWGWQLRSSPKTCLSCSNAGDPFWILANHVKWKRACSASMALPKIRMEGAHHENGRVTHSLCRLPAWRSASCLCVLQ